jgi:hypothetical protein
MLWSLGLVVGKIIVSFAKDGDDDGEDEDDADKGKSADGGKGVEKNLPVESSVYGFPPREPDDLAPVAGGLGLADDDTASRHGLQSTATVDEVRMEDVRSGGPLVSERGPGSPGSWPSELSPTSERRPPV